MNNYTYACFELNIDVKDHDIYVKIPFEDVLDALLYINTHADESFHKRVWAE